jgi:hypothetical protein
MAKVENNGKNKRKGRGLKIALIILLLIIVIIAAIFGGAYWYVEDKLGKMQQVKISDEELQINDEVEESLSGYRNIAIFGVDSRSSNLGKGNRSDCIIIASINEKTKEVKLASVYRDTYVQIQGHGLDKINHAYSYGEAPLALGTLNTNLDLNVKEFVTVNFDAVAEAVDELGGVQINVEQNEIEYLNMYQIETSKVTGKEIKQVTKSGLQTLNGVQAVSYGRIRYTAGGDYKRTERMRDVIEAMLKKLQTKSIGEINTLLDNILPKIYTNISTGSIISEIPSITKYKITDSIGWPYNTKGKTMTLWYGIPITLESNVVQLHQELFGESDYKVSDTIKEISNKIIEKTGYTN